MDTLGQKHIKLIVKKAMKLCKADMGEYKWYFDLAIDGYQDLRLHYVEEGKEIVKLPVNTTLKSVDFPSDMIRFIKLGIIVNGEFITFTRKDSINPTTSESGSEYYDTTIGEGEDIQDNYNDGLMTRGGVNTDGYFYIDYKNRRITLRNYTATTVWLHYITSGVHLDSETYLPVEYEQVIIAYIIWRFSQYNSDVPLSRIEHLERQYINEATKLKNNQIGSINELEDTLDSLIHNGIRR